MPLDPQTIRQSFIKHFQGHGHEHVPSAPVRPFAHEETLLFTNAGMNQFKPILLGQQTPEHHRVVNSQKCIRASGKHNDLDDVGYDTFHHTFFEMLGNWSFNSSYSKQDAMHWAWDLLTREWKIDPHFLYVTYHKDDPETAQLWKDVAGLQSEQIVPLGDKDNFWEMGNTGPCGPCTEIHFDAHRQWLTGNFEKAVEIWNIVFIQHERTEDGTLKSLNTLHIDTGMGLERLLAVMDGVYDNYKTALFQPIIETILEETSADPEKDIIALRVIADHIRCISVAGCDGIMPGNEGRQYVMRRILRRACQYIHHIGLNEPLLHKLVTPVSEILGCAYPEIAAHHEGVSKFVKKEEEAFWRTLKEGGARIEEKISRRSKDGETSLEGKDVFQLYDTFGLPLDIIELIATEKGFSIDRTEFKKLLESQREHTRLKDTHNTKNKSKENISWNHTNEHGPENRETIFTGYNRYQERSCKLISLGTQAQLIYIVLDKTPFYPEGGGQIGDTGTLKISSTNDEISVTQTTKDGGWILHHIAPEHYHIAEKINKSETLSATIDIERRKNITRNHSATHLLHAALREILGPHVRQQGSRVGDESLRFDFSHPAQLSEDEVHQIESWVSEKIFSAQPVDNRQMPFKQALEEGALAFFDEKYGEKVRVIHMHESSMELCGGTHVQNLSEIGLFQITRESAVAQGIRRIEAKTGIYAKAYLERFKDIVHNINRKLKQEKDSDPQQKIEKLQATLKELKKLPNPQENNTPHTTDEVITKNGETIPLIIQQRREHEEKDSMRKSALMLCSTQKKPSIIIASAPIQKNPQKMTILITLEESLSQRFPAQKLLGNIILLNKENRGGGNNGLAMGIVHTLGAAEIKKAVQGFTEST